MCVPPQAPPLSKHAKCMAASAKTLAAAGYKRDERLNVASIPGTSFNPIGFLELPIFLTLAFLYRAQFKWHLLGPMFVIYMWKECIPMSTCLHRYFSHKGFKCGRVTQFGLYILGCLASQVRVPNKKKITRIKKRRARGRARPLGRGIKKNQKKSLDFCP